MGKQQTITANELHELVKELASRMEEVDQAEAMELHLESEMVDRLQNAALAKLVSTFTF